MLGASPRPASKDRMKPAGRWIHTPHFDVERANIWTILRSPCGVSTDAG